VVAFFSFHGVRLYSLLTLTLAGHDCVEKSSSLAAELRDCLYFSTIPWAPQHFKRLDALREVW
jgi:hypothetical protein